MKKLYVLVFLIMFMGKIFSSDSITFKNLRENHGSFYIDQLFPTPNNINLKFKLAEAENEPLNELIIPKSNFTYSGENGSGGHQYAINKEVIDKIKLLLAKHSEDLISIGSFFKTNSIKMPTLTLSDLKDNPWDTIAPKALADKYDLKESDLKSMGISNWARETILGGKPLTLEERFMLRLQKALVEKIRGMTNAKDIIEPLKALLSANDKRPADFGKKTITEILNVVRPYLQPAVIKEIPSLDPNPKTKIEVEVLAASKDYFGNTKIALDKAQRDLETKKAAEKVQGSLDQTAEKFKVTEELRVAHEAHTQALKVNEVAKTRYETALGHAFDHGKLTPTYSSEHRFVNSKGV